MERYLRILNYHKNEIVVDIAYQLCKFSLNEASFLNYRPSQIAAAAVILSINIYEKDMRNQKRRAEFFKDSQINQEGLTELNTRIWNNEYVYNIT